MLKMNAKDEQLRESILSAPMYRILLTIALPLMLYNGLNNLFSVFDTMMAAYIGSDIVSSVAYLTQVKLMLTAVGAGLTLAGSMLIARHIGAGDLEKVKQYVSTLLFVVVAIALIMAVLTVGGAPYLLRILGMPKELLTQSLTYFRFEMVTLVLVFINQTFIAIEKAKGQSGRIFRWNILVMVIKLLATLIFILLWHKGIVWLSFASAIAHGSLTVWGFSRLMREKSVFGFARDYITLNKELLMPLFALAFPIFLEKFIFSLGKIVVNGMSVYYGVLAVGALGVSNNIGGMVTSYTLGIQDAEASIVSQNMGNNKRDRARSTFWYALLFSGLFGLMGTGVIFTFMDPLVRLFAHNDVAFAAEIKRVVRYEALAIPLLGISASCMGYLYGLGQTRITLVINMMRLLVYRIPILYVLIHFTNFGIESLGMAMMGSNILVGITAFAAVLSVMKHERGRL